MSWSENKITQTARNLVQARLSTTPRDTYPGVVPPDLSTAYAVQSSAIEQWPDQLVGFKVGGIAESFRDQYQAEWLAGPVFEKNTFRFKTGELLDFPVFEDGFAAFEPELIFEIQSKAYQAEETWSTDLAKTTIKRLYLGAEIASSPNSNVNALGPGSIISDFGNNGGCILGKELPLSELENVLNLQVETIIDGESVGLKSPGAPPSGPLGALAFLLNHFKAHNELYDLPETIFVSSGAITGVHESYVGAIGEMAYKGQETLKVKLVTNSNLVDIYL